ncbi:MAG: aspartate/glutamate racemase family protein [Desulfococcaceae bacterium]
MKTIGLLGGMSWESTETYYRLVNEGVKARLGGLHSARLILYSVDFQEIEDLQRAGDWEGAGNLLGEAARRVEMAGADFLLICTNTMHRVAAEVERNITIPLLHIADAAGEAIRERGWERVGLIGTRFTMEQDFYRGRLRERFGLETLIPPAEDRRRVHDVIFQELCLGRTDPNSRTDFYRIIESMVDEGAEAVILGCTEISLLVRSEDTPVALLDTTRIHAEKAVEAALAE